MEIVYLGFFALLVGGGIAWFFSIFCDAKTLRTIGLVAVVLGLFFPLTIKLLEGPSRSPAVGIVGFMLLSLGVVSGVTGVCLLVASIFKKKKA